MTCDVQDKSSERLAEEDKSISSRADYDSSDGSCYSDDSSSSSSWDSDLDDLEAFVVSSSVFNHRTQSSPDISSLRKTQNPAKQLMARMRQCESFGFPPCLSEHVNSKHELNNSGAAAGRFGDTTKPEDVLDKLLRSNGISSGMLVCADSSFLKVTDDHVKSYTAAAKAAREGAIDKLQKLYQDGANLQASNIYGETLVHLVCRRGESSMLRFLIGAKVSVRVRDDHGRTPLHDAAWTDQPNFEIVQQLLENSPDLLLVKDKRGHSPLAYVPSQRRAEWCRFLEEHEEFIEAAIESKFTLSA